MSEQDTDQGKRQFLVAATTVAGGVAAGATAVPFVASMLPSERAKAAGAPVEVDLSKQRPRDPSPIGGQMILISHRWSHHANHWYQDPRNAVSSLVSPCPTNTHKSAY